MPKKQTNFEFPPEVREKICGIMEMQPKLLRHGVVQDPAPVSSRKEAAQYAIGYTYLRLKTLIKSAGISD